MELALTEQVYQPLAETNFSQFAWENTPLGPYDSWASPLTCWVQFLLMSAQPTLLLWGADQTLIFNDAYARTLGARYPEILGKPFAQVAAPIWDHLSQYVEDAYAGRSGVVEDIELPIWRTGYSETGFYSFAYTPVFSPEGGAAPIGVLSLLTDRTDKIAYKKKLARELDLLQEVYEHAPGFIAMAEGPEHRFKFANAAYRELVGREDIIGRTVAEVLPEIQSQGFIDLLDRVFQTGVPYVGRAIPIEFQIDPNSPPKKRYIDTIYHPVRDADGTIIGLFAEGHDVTEHVQAETLAGKLQSQLLRVSRSTAMESFGSAVAHEINQPLAPAVNYLAIARKLVGGGEQQEALTNALDKASAATMRAGDILRRMRALATTGSTSSQPTDLTVTVLEAIALVRMASPNISVLTASLESAVVMADSVQVQQVLMNLLKNAQEAMVDSAQPEIVISITKGQEFATVRVEDRGPGIPPEKIHELFEWFVTTKSEGTGIGLPISQRIVEAHAGRIWAENGEDGAIFSFTLPLANEGIEKNG
jgi:signal transduction histidine kinase